MSDDKIQTSKPKEVSAADTLMGMRPTPGDHAARVLASRNGASAGVDTSIPNQTAVPYTAV